MKIEKKVEIEKVKMYEVYGKQLDSKEKAINWKNYIESNLKATYFIVMLDPDTEGNFTTKILFKMYSWIGMSGVIAKLEKMGIPLIKIHEGKFIKNVEITKLERFKTWEELVEFQENNEFTLEKEITEGDLK